MDANAAVELQLLDVTVSAQRALLRARRPEQVVDALERVVLRLGGSLVPGHVGGPDVLHLDVGLGVAEPSLPCAAPGDPARARLERVLPGLVEDATRVVQRLWRLAEQGDPTLLDELTAALSVPATRRLIDRAVAGDVLLGLALTDADGIATTHGSSRVDLHLHRLAAFARSELDVDERLGRLDGPAIVVVLPHPDPLRAEELRHRLARRWERHDRSSGTLEGAVVTVDQDPAAALADLGTALQLDTHGTADAV
jgi:GGDEF domain-containing protein